MSDKNPCVRSHDTYGGFQIRWGNIDKFWYISTKTYVVGTQKNHLNEMVLLSAKNILLDFQIWK